MIKYCAAWVIHIFSINSNLNESYFYICVPKPSEFALTLSKCRLMKILTVTCESNQSAPALLMTNAHILIMVNIKALTRFLPKSLTHSANWDLFIKAEGQHLCYSHFLLRETQRWDYLSSCVTLKVLGKSTVCWATDLQNCHVHQCCCQYSAPALSLSSSWHQ